MTSRMQKGTSRPAGVWCKRGIAFNAGTGIIGLLGAGARVYQIGCGPVMVAWRRNSQRQRIVIGTMWNMTALHYCSGCVRESVKSCEER